MALGFLLGLRVAVLLGLLLGVMSGGGGFRLTPSAIAGTLLGTARRARRRCRWLMAVRS